MVYEAEYGAFTEEEMEGAERAMSARAITVTFPDDEQPGDRGRQRSA